MNIPKLSKYSTCRDFFTASNFIQKFIISLIIKLKFRDKHTVYQFMGCFHHGCPRCFTTDRNDKKDGWLSFNEKLERTKKITKKIIDAGYEYVEKWECEWRKDKKNMVSKPINKYLYPMEDKYRLTEHQILEGIRNGTLFGAILCDIHVPDNLKEKFSEMTPIFKHAVVSEDDIGPHMREFLSKRKESFKPTKYLIGSMYGKGILIISELARWYLENGLIITRIEQFIQFQPKRCFKAFADQVTNDRRQGSIILIE